MTAAVTVERLQVEIDRRSARFLAVTDVDFSVAPGEALGIVGESGCGKSLALRAIAETLPPRTRLADGLVTLNGSSSSTSMIFQEPLAAMNPTRRVGDLIADAVMAKTKISRAGARRRAVELLNEVGVPDAQRRLRAWPHELSGGLRQRVIIAMSLATDPTVLLCDEPTTALDVTVQDQILGLIDRLRRERDMAVVFVTHDLAVVATLCQRIAVMYGGQIVESGPTSEVLADPRHPYTRALLEASRSRTNPTDARPIGGHPPDPADFPEGCRFADRCVFAVDACRTAPYALDEAGPGRVSACIRIAERPWEGVPA